ncbi:hypothetical protein EYF80_060836 [Liparis tanakae]|uniref:Uncharacterized protein n=1 Tax=Liparis tanakae TaxID=230148 RepID=A0A4Z2EJH9_9TELE|nr:hypothetical protein EYF80_060836 [Liparis tanakae]
MSAQPPPCLRGRLLCLPLTPSADNREAPVTRGRRARPNPLIPCFFLSYLSCCSSPGSGLGLSDRPPARLNLADNTPAPSFKCEALL